MIPEIRVANLIVYATSERTYFGSFYDTLLLLGIFFGAVVVSLRAREAGVSVCYTLVCSMIFALVGLIGSQLLYLAYSPTYLEKVSLWEVLTSLHHPKSSLGGMLFGAVAFLAVTGITKPECGRLNFIDIIIPGAIVGFIFGRLGCTLLHDHIGVHTSFLLGVHYADGVRHNLGMYEWLFLLFCLYPLALFLKERRLVPGALAGICIGTYSLVRFLLDFLRLDTTYLWLTPAQYGCIVLLTLSGFMILSTARGACSEVVRSCFAGEHPAPQNRLPSVFG